MHVVLYNAQTIDCFYFSYMHVKLWSYWPYQPRMALGRCYRSLSLLRHRLETDTGDVHCGDAKGWSDRGLVCARGNVCSWLMCAGVTRLRGVRWP